MLEILLEYLQALSQHCGEFSSEELQELADVVWDLWAAIDREQERQKEGTCTR